MRLYTFSQLQYKLFVQKLGFIIKLIEIFNSRTYIELQLKDVESFREAITSLIGKTFMFGVYIESSNVSSKGGMYKVGKVWKDLSMLLTGGCTTESFTQSFHFFFIFHGQNNIRLRQHKFT